MKQNATLLALLLLTSTAAPAAAQLEGGIGGALRRLPFFSWNRETEQPEADSYELPAPIENVDEPVPIYDNDGQTDPMSTWIWAHTVDINTVKRQDLYQYGMDVRRILAMRKLEQAGYAHHPQGTYADLSGLSEKGHYYLEQLKRPEIQALLATIAFAEGTFRDNGYSTGFGYVHIDDLSKHPMTVWNGSSAAGRYQFMNYTWPGNAAAVGVKDFTPLSQDIVALHLIENKRGVKLDEFTTTDFENVMHRLAKEWASIPCGPGGGSCYTFKGRPQPAKPMATLRTVFDNGMKGELPKMGYSWHWWNDAWSRSMKDFQFAYEVKAHGDFDEETWRAVFDGEFGTAGGQEPIARPVAEAAPLINVASKAALYDRVQDTKFYLKASIDHETGTFESGLKAIRLEVIDTQTGGVVDGMLAFSGIRGRQDFSSQATLTGGSRAPSPQGVYDISGERVKANGPVPGKVRGIDGVWIYMRPLTHVGSRAQLGIHGNFTGSNATAGCIGLWSLKDSHTLYDWVTTYDLTRLVVDWDV